MYIVLHLYTKKAVDGYHQYGITHKKKKDV